MIGAVSFQGTLGCSIRCSSMAQRHVARMVARNAENGRLSNKNNDAFPVGNQQKRVRPWPDYSITIILSVTTCEDRAQDVLRNSKVWRGTPLSALKARLQGRLENGTILSAHDIPHDLGATKGPGCR
jgi:hypothetical protein